MKTDQVPGAQPQSAKPEQDFLALFSAGMILVIFSAHFSKQIILGHTPTKLMALVLCAVGIVYLFKHRHLRISGGMTMLLMLAIYPPLLHGYINTGLVFHALIALVICSVGFELEKVLRGCIFFVLLLYFFILLGFFLTFDMSFIRNMTFPVDIYNYMPCSNPNVLSRLLLIMTPVLFMSHSIGVLNKKFLLFLLLGTLLTIAIVTGSRANLMAFIVMVSYWFFLQKAFLGRFGFISKSALILGGMLIILIIPGIQSKIERGYLIVTETHRLVESSTSSYLEEGIAPARSKTWAAAILLVKQSPWIGWGQNTDRRISEMGAKNQAGNSIAVHGGMMNIVTSTGLVGLAMFLSAMILLYRKFGIYVRMLLIGAFVSQIGADIYSQTIFWLILGMCLFYDNNSERFGVNKTSISNITLSKT